MTVTTPSIFANKFNPVAVVLASLIWTLTPLGSSAQEAAKTPPSPKDTDVVARIDGNDVTGRDMRIAARDMGQQFSKVPEAQRMSAILSMLIDVKILAKQAESEGLAKDEDFLSRMALLRARALHNTYFRLKVQGSIKPEDIKKRYEAEIAGAKPEEEVSARHILVKTEQEAKDLIKLLDEGADFIALAKEKSTGPSGPGGGDLGFFGKGRMVPEFDKVVFDMEIGSYSKQPVKTQFGYHIIKLEKRRKMPPPKFETVQTQIRDLLLRERYNKVVADAREKVKIEFVDKSLAPPEADATKNSN